MKYSPLFMGYHPVALKIAAKAIFVGFDWMIGERSWRKLTFTPYQIDTSAVLLVIPCLTIQT